MAAKSSDHATIPQSPQQQPIIRKQRIPSDVQDESVYKLIPEHVIPPQKQSMYRSKFAKQARDEYFDGLKAAASMGPLKVVVNDTKDFVRKGDRERKFPPKEKVTPDKTIRKAPVPKTPGKIPPETKKDFINLNILENVNSEAKKPVDNKPVYRQKPDYGKTPEYLEKKKQQLTEQAAKSAEADKESNSQKIRSDGLVLLPESERLKILDGLKANWEKLNSDYQKLSLTVDTVPKIARKVNMEQQLKQLETNIQKFSHPDILVDFNSLYAPHHSK
ncbi:hypothetical protein HK098_007539 [Nowakowskiella sp. JEL0407]|nr:hypothetical protein HK098_007539 [Nowakowskiella sp. JEL0407]